MNLLSIPIDTNLLPSDIGRQYPPKGGICGDVELRISRSSTEGESAGSQTRCRSVELAFSSRNPDSCTVVPWITTVNQTEPHVISSSVEQPRPHLQSSRSFSQPDQVYDDANHNVIAGVQRAEAVINLEALETNVDFLAVNTHQEFTPLAKTKLQEVPREDGTLQEIIQDSEKSRKITPTNKKSTESRKRRREESHIVGTCFDLEIEFMDRPYGRHLLPSLTIYISDDSSIYGVLSTLLVLHCDHFATSDIDPENVWLVELFLPVKDTEAAPGEQFLVEEIDMEESVDDNKEIWEVLG